MKDMVFLQTEIKTPPMSTEARLKAGLMLRELQRGDILGMPHSRPMPVIGPRCHELRIRDDENSWRVMYRVDLDEVLVVDVFAKKTETTPKRVIKRCQRRLAEYDSEE